MKAATGRKLTFAEWMKAVDAILEKKVGLDSGDLPDIPYGDLYEDGASPASAAKGAVRYAKGGDYYD